MKIFMLCKRSLILAMGVNVPSAFYMVESVHSDHAEAKKLAQKKNQSGRGDFVWSVKSKKLV